MDDIQAAYLVAAQLHVGPFDKRSLKVKADQVLEAIQTTRKEQENRSRITVHVDPAPNAGHYYQGVGGYGSQNR